MLGTLKSFADLWYQKLGIPGCVVVYYRYH